MSAKTRKSKYEGKWLGFMDVNLTVEQKENCRLWDADGMTLDALLDDFVAGGYKFAAVWNEKTQSVIVSLTGLEGAGENAGYTMSAHAKDFAKAVHVLAYKHVVLAQGNWGSVRNAGDDSDFG